MNAEQKLDLLIEKFDKLLETLNEILEEPDDFDEVTE